MSEEEKKEKKELSPEITFEDDFTLVKESNEYPLSTRSVRLAQQFLSQRDSNPKDSSTAHLEEEAHILFEEWNSFYLKDKRNYQKTLAPEFKNLRDSIGGSDSVSSVKGLDDPKIKGIQPKDIQEIFSQNTRLSHVLSTPTSLLPSPRGSMDFTGDFKSPTKRISLGGPQKQSESSLTPQTDEKKPKNKNFFSKVFGQKDVKPHTQSEPQAFSFSERVPSRRMSTKSSLSTGKTSRKNSFDKVGQSFYDKETKTSILEILNNDRINDNDLQKIQPFLKTSRAVEEEYLEEDEYHKFMSLNNNFWTWVPAEELQCDRTRYIKISPYPESG
jgi:hypothetical protein